MRKSAVLVLSALLASGLVAASAVKLDPVAPGFPDWQGMSAKSYLAGREIEPSDLRHKVTIVVEMALGEKWAPVLPSLASLINATGLGVGLGHGMNWEDGEVPRNVIVVVNVRGAKSEAVHEALKAPKGAEQTVSQMYMALTSKGCSYYDGVTFTGAPDNEGKVPHVYVMGPTGTEPLFKGVLDAAGLKGALAAIAKGKKEIDGWDQKWQPFYGNVAEPKFNTLLKKTLDKGKLAKKAPLGPVEKALLTDIKSKDEEKAKEAQILYDALVQTRSDLILRIQMEAPNCPHRAYYDIQTLLKYWPTMTKKLEAVSARMKAIPDIDLLGRTFVKLMMWGDPAFTCKPSEAKKIVVELNKIKKSLSGPKESKNTVVQNGAALLDMRVDEVISLMQSRVDTK